MHIPRLKKYNNGCAGIRARAPAEVKTRPRPGGARRVVLVGLGVSYRLPAQPFNNAGRQGGCAYWIAVAYAFAHSDYVRGNVVVLVAEPRPGASYSGGDLVHHNKATVAGYGFRHPHDQLAGREPNQAGGASRLEDEGPYVLDGYRLPVLAALVAFS